MLSRLLLGQMATLYLVSTVLDKCIDCQSTNFSGVPRGQDIIQWVNGLPFTHYEKTVLPVQVLQTPHARFKCCQRHTPELHDHCSMLKSCLKSWLKARLDQRLVKLSINNLHLSFPIPTLHFLNRLPELAACQSQILPRCTCHFLPCQLSFFLFRIVQVAELIGSLKLGNFGFVFSWFIGRGSEKSQFM